MFCIKYPIWHYNFIAKIAQNTQNTKWHVLQIIEHIPVILSKFKGNGARQPQVTTFWILIQYLHFTYFSFAYSKQGARQPCKWLMHKAFELLYLLWCWWYINVITKITKIYTERYLRQFKCSSISFGFDNT